MSRLQNYFRKSAGLPVELLKLDGQLGDLFHIRASGMLAGGNHEENMRQLWRTSDILKAKFKQPPTLDAALNHVTGLLRYGDDAPVVKQAQAPWRMLENLPKVLARSGIRNFEGAPVAQLRRSLTAEFHPSADWMSGRTPGHMLRTPDIAGRRAQLEIEGAQAKRFLPLLDENRRLVDRPAGYQPDFITAPRMMPRQDATLHRNFYTQANSDASVEGMLGRLDPNYEGVGSRSPFDSRLGSKDEFLHRGVAIDDISRQQFHPGQQDVAWGGGYYGGALHHATPELDTAMGYSRNAGESVGVVNHYAPAAGQRYMPDWGIENTMRSPRSGSVQITNDMRAGSNAYETAISQQHNPLVGTSVGVPGSYAHIQPGDESSYRTLGHYMRNTTEQLPGATRAFDPNFRVAGKVELPGRLQDLQGQNLPAFDQIMQRRAERYVLPMQKVAELRPRLCWNCGKGTDPADKPESHYGRCDCRDAHTKQEDLATVKSASLLTIAAVLRRARNATHTHPTPGQASAGNYRKGALQIHGLNIKIENPKGTERRGYDKDGNVQWARTMDVADYGYFVGSTAVDGDAVDCFLGPDLDSHFVAVVDQMKPDGSYDESKVILGTTSKEQAEKLYLANYPRGWALGPVSTTTVQQLKEWLKNGDTKSPFKGQMVKAAKHHPCHWTLFGETPPTQEEQEAYANRPAPKAVLFKGTFKEFLAHTGRRREQEKSAMVKQDEETGKWVLWTKDGKRKLGTHATAADAYKQEYAIQKSQEAHKATTPEA